jgi:hypothetical protein
MSSLHVKQEVWSILDTEWSGTRVLDMENKAADVNSEMTPWVSPHFISSTEEQIGLGDAASRYWRETGSIHLLVAVPARSGWQTADTHAKNLGKLFRARSVGSDLVFQAVSPPTLYTEDETVLGNWSIKFISVRYMYTYADPT